MKGLSVALETDQPITVLEAVRVFPSSPDITPVFLGLLSDKLSSPIYCSAVIRALHKLLRRNRDNSADAIFKCKDVVRLLAEYSLYYRFFSNHEDDIAVLWTLEAKLASGIRHVLLLEVQ